MTQEQRPTETTFTAFTAGQKLMRHGAAIATIIYLTQFSYMVAVSAAAMHLTDSCEAIKRRLPDRYIKSAIYETLAWGQYYLSSCILSLSIYQVAKFNNLKDPGMLATISFGVGAVMQGYPGCSAQRELAASKPIIAVVLGGALETIVTMLHYYNLGLESLPNTAQLPLALCCAITIYGCSLLKCQVEQQFVGKIVQPNEQPATKSQAKSCCS